MLHDMTHYENENFKTIINKHLWEFNNISEDIFVALPICQTHHLEKIVKLGHGHKSKSLVLFEYLSTNGFNSVTHLMWLYICSSYIDVLCLSFLVF